MNAEIWAPGKCHYDTLAGMNPNPSVFRFHGRKSKDTIRRGEQNGSQDTLDSNDEGACTASKRGRSFGFNAFSYVIP